MKATHWSAYEKPEDWSDNPAPTPREAVEQFIADRTDDGAWDLRNEIPHGRADVVVRGYIETNAPLPESEQFDGYEAGKSYFAATGETVTVRVTLAFEVVEK